MDQDEHVPLPDLNYETPDEYFYGVDYSLINCDELERDDTPFYPNQLQDPDVDALHQADLNRCYDDWKISSYP